MENTNTVVLLLNDTLFDQGEAHFHQQARNIDGGFSQCLAGSLWPCLAVPVKVMT